MRILKIEVDNDNNIFKDCRIFSYDNIPNNINVRDLFVPDNINNINKSNIVKTGDGNYICKLISETTTVTMDISTYIYMFYSQSKQSSDLADKLYFENILKAKGVKTLEKTIVTKITAFNDGKTFDEILVGVVDENKEAMAQLLKVGIRVSWVQACKSELKTAIAENREPVYPEFPEI